MSKKSFDLDFDFDAEFGSVKEQTEPQERALTEKEKFDTTLDFLEDFNFSMKQKEPPQQNQEILTKDPLDDFNLEEFSLDATENKTSQSDVPIAQPDIPIAQPDVPIAQPDISEESISQADNESEAGPLTIEIQDELEVVDASLIVEKTQEKAAIAQQEREIVNPKKKIKRSKSSSTPHVKSKTVTSLKLHLRHEEVNRQKSVPVALIITACMFGFFIFAFAVIAIINSSQPKPEPPAETVKKEQPKPKEINLSPYQKHLNSIKNILKRRKVKDPATYVADMKVVEAEVQAYIDSLDNNPENASEVRILKTRLKSLRSQIELYQIQ
ncbi:MAG: hypothetical protein MK193_08755 [Lentisphaeria bacterium]|nr:hypothetical protein [Lentisphaeria bacterium]